MPHKPPAHMRTWGTRFDTLPSSPLPQSTTDEATHDILNASCVSDLSSQPFLHRKDKMPHDASIFVGSLPSHVSHAELSRLLSIHLSEHMEIKSVKVVQDSKGGICAFVQCEDASSAANLLQTLHSIPQKPLLGRILRYEPARAFRTLLISYRTPIQYIPSNFVEGHRFQKKGQCVELDLPYAMRIWRPKNSRFYSILYNEEALDAERPLRDKHASEHAGLYLHPVSFDAQTIETLASYFGRLEYIIPYNLQGQNTVSEGSSSPDEARLPYPSPHDARRSPSMDGGCWEIKWDHRDNCISALTTLRRVPHLTVTWAHQQQTIFDSRFSRKRVRVGSGTEYSLQSGRTHGNPSASIQHDDFIRDFHDDELPDLSSLSVHHRIDWSEQDCHSSEETIDEPGPWSRRPSCERESVESKVDEMPSRAITSREIALETTSEQEIEVPPMPELAMSPTTPQTAASQGLVTPINDVVDAKFVDSDEKSQRFVVNEYGREIDPLTLFVGGLETFGPGAWDEEKVKGHFSRFGGLESVKLVRPLNSHVAFAFVKFNNSDSPARAVVEEHNRVYEGRAMRVQLRECNPHRSHWKYNRTRGRANYTQYPHQYNLDRSGAENMLAHLPVPIPGPASLAPTYTANEPTVENDRTSPEESSPAVGEPEHATDNPPTTDSSHDALVTHSDSLQNWHESSAPSIAPTPSVGSSSSIPASAPFSFQLPPAPAYYAPSQWIQPFPHQGFYPLQYFGYSAYPGGQTPTQNASATNHNANSQSITHPQSSWPSSGYGSYIPYIAPPARTSDAEQAQSTQHLDSRAPVVPTGFIQKEQGTLIAVYQPEALDQYMAGNQLVRSGFPTTMPSWPPYLPPQNYPIPPPLMHRQQPAVSGPPMNAGWVPNSGYFPLPQPNQISTQPFALDLHKGGSVPPGVVTPPNAYRRYSARKDYLNGHGHGNKNRSSNNKLFWPQATNTACQPSAGTYPGPQPASQENGEWT